MEENMVQIPFVVHESSMTRMEHIIKRLIIALIIAILLMFASNALWLYAWMQYDYSSAETVTVDGKDGIANYIGNDGDITNGTNYSEESENKDNKKDK